IPKSGLDLWTSQGDSEVSLRIGESGLAAETPVTVHQLFAAAVESYGQHTALSWKDGQLYKKLSYREYYQNCRTAAKSFLKLGLQRYHGVGILGFNSPEWFIADLGAIFAGGFAVGIYATNSAEACQYVAANCKANILVVENQKQLQKILQVRPDVKHFWKDFAHKTTCSDVLRVPQWKQFMDLGRNEPDPPLDAILSSQKPNQCCTLIYTSGTTGQPKGVMLSHDNLTWTALSVSRHTKLNRANQNQEVFVSYLPLSHIAAQMVDIWIALKVGAVTYFAQPDALKGSLVNTLQEARPTAILGVPRVWEKMQEKMKAKGARSCTVAKMVVAWAKGVGLRNNIIKMDLCVNLNIKLIFKRVRSALGLDRCTKCFTGAAPISRDTLEFFLSLDIPLYELYGMSECSGPHTISIPTSGGSNPENMFTKLYNPDQEGIGEICFWGRHVFMGYLNMAKMTQEAVDADGWLHSGDLGKQDRNGFLYITGRIKELIITAGGENIPPVPIEDAVKEVVPLISNAMLIGDRKKFLSMLLTVKCQVNAESGEPEDDLTPEAVQFCRSFGSNATKVSEIAGGRDQAVNKAIQEGINRVNEKATSNAQRIQKWTILDHDFSMIGGELGPTMKLKRPVVMNMYKDKIEEMMKNVRINTQSAQL
uniref:Long-chain-fatty-acid--CoA ligase ACSBG2 n=1 Tax=Cynoglossus semilaevis TaxID=244447 RepID=A0A3P8WG65_CYNSE